jgi:hypothetical protein
MRYLILLLPLFLFAIEPIVKFENIKPYYYPKEKVAIKLKIVLPIKENIKIIPPKKIEYSIYKKSPFVYYMDLNFSASKNIGDLVIFGTKIYADINLSKKINIIEFTPPKNYSNIVANSLKITNVITSNYNKNYNLVNFNIECNGCDIRNFSLGLKDEKLTPITTTQASYIGLVPKNKTSLTLYYFNLPNQKFQKISIPLNTKEEIISTQIQINPEDQSIFTPINILLIATIIFLTLIFVLSRLYILLIIPFALLIFFIYLIFPKGSILLQKGTKVQILPTPQSTIIYITKKEEKALVLDRKKDYTKIKIDNKIGWIKND